MADLLEDALEHLMAPGYTLSEAISLVPVAPGLYAFHGSADTWQQPGLGTPRDDRPLYIGKAEKSLLSRDVKGHFATGKTGSSTVRRSLAALLSAQLALIAQPRNVMMSTPTQS